MGRELEAITLTRFDGQATEALTDNFLKVRVTGRHPANQLVGVRVDSERLGELTGHAVERNLILSFARRASLFSNDSAVTQETRLVRPPDTKVSYPFSRQGISGKKDF